MPSDPPRACGRLIDRTREGWRLLLDTMLRVRDAAPKIDAGTATDSEKAFALIAECLEADA